ncbi:MAG TPA: TrkA C-terminal domain-containing protein [Planctomycetota bacterium]|nr:TrkA C-terminal domain-containing protein [Planctomycetota bacterium]
MAILFSLLVIVAVSLLIVKIGAVALTMTGLSRDVANFQAQSAFSGVGFTTAESEYITSHPLRRRIVRVLMLFGTAGITSAVATLVLTFTQHTGQDLLLRFGMVAGGLVVLFLVARSRLVDRMMTKAIQRALAAATRLHIRDYDELLQLERGYAVAQLLVKEGTWLAEKTLRTLNLTGEGIVVLNMTRSDGTVGTPTPDAVIHAGERLLCYGFSEQLEALSARTPGTVGDDEHARAVDRHNTRRHVQSVEERTKPPGNGK